MEMEVRVGDCMTKGVVAIPMTKPVAEAAKAMGRTKVGSVIVLRNGKAVGIVTERDVIRKVVAHGYDPKKVTLSSAMSTPLHVIKIDTPIGEAARAMRKFDIKKLPVVNEKGLVVGMVTETDILRAYPGLVDVLIEASATTVQHGEEPVVGVCERCGTYSAELKIEGGILLCEECREEVEEEEE